MDPNRLYQAHSADWQSLANLLKQAERDLSRLSPADVDTLGWLYRMATSDLALAKRDFPRHPVAAFLNQLVGRGHAVLYRSEPLVFRRVLHFVTAGFPQVYRESLPFIFASALLFFVPALLAGIAIWIQPDAAQALLPPQVAELQGMIEGGELWTDIPVSERPYASSFIMRNNIQVAFLAFGSGVLAGIYTVWILAYNGLILGGLTGLTAHYGLGFELWTFVVGHGVIELSVIVIAGGMGLMLGWAILRPGLLRRQDALRIAAGKAVRLVVGCVPLLVLAGLIEGFLSPNELIPWPVKWAVGLGSGAVLYAYLFLAGRRLEEGPKGFQNL